MTVLDRGTYGWVECVSAEGCHSADAIRRFYDEATSHLDVQQERLINDAIKQLKVTRVIVAHRPETIAAADRVIVLGPGPHPASTAERDVPEAAA